MDIITYLQSFFITTPNTLADKPEEIIALEPNFASPAQKTDSTSYFERLGKIVKRHLIDHLYSLLPAANWSPEQKRIAALIDALVKGPGMQKQCETAIKQLGEYHYGAAIKTIGPTLFNLALFIPLLSSDPKLRLAGVSLEIAADLIEVYGELDQEHYLEPASILVLTSNRIERAAKLISTAGVIKN